MKRTRSSKSSLPPSAILTADWHIRPSAPVCRTDDFIAAMWKKVEFILELGTCYGIPILIAGDLGLKSQWPNWLLEELIRRINGRGVEIYAIPGQHDLPNHSLDLWMASAIGVLHQAGAIKFLGVDEWTHAVIEMGYVEHLVFPFPYGIEISHYDQKKHVSSSRVIAIAHTLVTERAPEEFLADVAVSAMSLLEKFPEYDLILTGDNHHPFILNYEGRMLVNPGSMMRTTAEQVDHKPRVYLWYAEENRVDPVYLPIDENVIDRTHIDLQEGKDERIEAYVARLSEEVEIGLSFEGNLESYFKTNRIRKPVQDKVWEAMPK